MANNLCGGANYATVPVECREPEVNGATASLRYSADDLESVLSILFERLAPALSPNSPPNGDNAKSLGYGCKLAEDVQIQARRLQNLTAAARDITSRLEI